MATTKVSLQDFISMFSDGKGYVDGKQIKKIYFGQENFQKRELPEGYTQVEYIQSSGTQYIDTGFKPNQDTRVIMDFEPLETNTRFIFGARTAAVNLTYSFLLAGGDTTVRSDYGSHQASGTTSTVLQRVIIDRNKSVTTFGNTTITNTTSTFQCEYNLYLFSVNTAGTAYTPILGKLYSCQIYDSDVLIRDYVPCVNTSGEAGLFDIINSTFYQNAGTGTFTAGSSEHKGVALKLEKLYVGESENFKERELPEGYTQVEYIESNGTQYIDTGVKAKSSLVVQTKFNMTEVTGYSIVGHYTSETSCLRLFNASGVCYLDFGNATGGRIYGGTMLANVDYNVEFGNLYAKNLDTGANIISGSAVANFEHTTNMFIFGNSNFSKGKIYYCKIYDNDTLIRDYVPCKNKNGTVGLYDVVNNTFNTNAGSGTFISGSTHSNVSRLLCTLKGELKYYGTVTSLSGGGQKLAATTVGNYALFGGGWASSGVSAVVSAYNKSLTRSIPTALSVARYGLVATTVSDYALFGGGLQDAGTNVAVVDVYNKSLTRSTATALSVARHGHTGAFVGNYALFAGGNTGSAYTTEVQTTVDAYNSSLTRSTPTALTQGRSNLVATTVGDYALFGGGYNGGSASGTYVTTVDAYNSSLTRSTPTALKVGVGVLAAATVSDYALFGGGYNSGYASGGKYRAEVSAYNKSLTRSIPTTLSAARANFTAASSSDYALFGGGGGNNGTEYTIVDAYNATLTRSTPTALSVGRYDLAATAVGDYVLFGGGREVSGNYSVVVDAYTVA